MINPVTQIQESIIIFNNETKYSFQAPRKRDMFWNINLIQIYPKTKVTFGTIPCNI
jgi:hypothetical protein